MSVLNIPGDVRWAVMFLDAGKGREGVAENRDVVVVDVGHNILDGIKKT